MSEPKKKDRSMENVGGSCKACGAWMIPVDSGAVCSAAVDGQCDSGKIVAGVTANECRMAYARLNLGVLEPCSVRLFIHDGCVYSEEGSALGRIKLGQPVEQEDGELIAVVQGRTRDRVSRLSRVDAINGIIALMKKKIDG